MYEKNYLLIPYNLQFFAPDGEGGEKTEDPTSKKLSDARKEGKVAKSKEIVNGVSLLGFFLALRIFLGFAGVRIEEIFRWIYTIFPDIVNMKGGLTMQAFMGIFRTLIGKTLIILMPFLVIGFAADFVTNLVQVGWKPTLKPLEPKLSKFNPISGFKRIFSKQSIVNLIFAIAKITLVFFIAYTSIKDQAKTLFLLYDISLKASLSLIFQIIVDTGIKISVVYIFLGFADYAYQRWKFKDDMKMTKQEVKDEYKNTEGDPQIKGKQRQRMMESSQRRMMKNVPQADVVITNPTHIAVAILYDNTKDEAPRVVAKGEDYLAKKIKDLAKDSNVPIVENKPLARALYATVEIDEVIPPELYQAVAEILAVVYTNRNQQVS
ncbi:MAG: flagellar biosynthesis protein FlhB [Pseudobutyrivibrio sp.]|uniref:flagellar biosynthesis protein FlhB n=1 Tax=Pseudobutyrivibrio sp. TaxID=2014367 RepID=UPI001B187FF3|nr:flagellar biosynthesis protein FlhB [Pseudobutyrivibrio sp.]MBO5617622.1 flagellar biosynthesis protein FlhB [Pseudobutyrivibrio sp.]MBO6283642.1 flagellar biosynthesis protein FlhB [Pseudobutyrivibrio sp.]MBP3260874.1 flagellar biosynthesis protein FlhB [Pseudobutyrivibrio sp.]